MEICVGYEPKSAPIVTAVGLIPEPVGLFTEVTLLTDDRLERALDIRDE